MAQYKAGDSIGDCPGCHTAGSVIYRGGAEGVCNKCGALWEVEFDEGEAEAPPEPAPLPQPAPLPEAHTPAPVDPQFVVESSVGIQVEGGPVEQTLQDAPHPEPPAVVIDEDVGQLTNVTGSTIESQKKSLKLDPSIGNDKGRALGIPAYILKSRPWRWAHELSKSGNPYRQGSKNWAVFNRFHEHECTIPELVTALDPEMGQKFSFLLTIYEVVSQCIAAGLLVMDPETRIIGACKGQPQPAKLT